MAAAFVCATVSFSGLLGAAAPVISAPVEDLSTPLQQKADRWVTRKLESGGSEEFLVVLRERADLSAATGLRDKNAKGQFVFERLRAIAERTQRPVLAWLAARGIEHRAFWVANMVLVRGDAAVARELAARDDIVRLGANPAVRLADARPASPPENRGAATKAAATGVEWGVAKVRAPELWAAGYTGQGIVVAGADTGVDWTHPALRGKYRGWDGVSADHNYNWHDAIHTPGSACSVEPQAPCDDGFHGTHTMGTMVGDDDAGNHIGVAPGARWIGCRNMDQGVGTPVTYAECFQWFLAPTDSRGLKPDPSKAPHIINNSWVCPPSEGCTDPNVLRTIVETMRAAGIVVVVSAGNRGACESISDAPAIYDAAVTVGATDSSDAIAVFSSRGPVTADGSNRLKPDISAPGVGVRSSVPNGGYAVFSGTSMAGPHVAGTAALLLSALPVFAGQPAALKSRIEQTALPRTSETMCGNVPGATVPNNTYGWGRLDAKTAYDGLPAVLDIDLSVDTTGYDALTDGLLMLRYLSGVTGPSLTAGALGATATRTDPDAITAYLDGIRSALDIDRNGAADALTDGLLIIRYLFGLRGAALVQNVIGPAATRTAAPDIETYINSLLP